MEDSSLCLLTGKMECPGLLSKRDLGSFHCHCLAHFQSYRLSMVGGLCGALHEDGHIWGSTEEKGGKPLNSFFLFFFLLLLSLAFFFFFFLVCVQGHKSSLVGALMDFLRLYLVPTLSFGSLGTVSVRSWSGSMSTSGRLSRWIMNLVALPIELGFNSHS